MTDKTVNEIVKYDTVDAFFDSNPHIRRSDMARMMGINRQQFTNWRYNKNYYVEYNIKTHDIKIIDPAVVISECKIEEFYRVKR